MIIKVTLSIILTLSSLLAMASPSNFSEAKVELRKFIYHDQTNNGTIYCGCSWTWAGASGGVIDLPSCGYKIAEQPNRAKRLEWEHIVPASNFGRARQCWQHGGRANCEATDPVFNKMESDMHNLAPSIGEVNADRSNFNYGELSSSSRNYGSCPFKVDFANRTAEPRDEVKGKVARVYFYMSDRYNLRLSESQQKLMMAWNKSFPVTANEKLIDSRVAQKMGHHNPFVTGQSQWELGHKNSGAGLVEKNASNALPSPALATAGVNPKGLNSVSIHGNKKSFIYHVANSCPDYSKISPQNVVEFSNEASAEAAGFRKARNCK